MGPTKIVCAMGILSTLAACGEPGPAGPDRLYSVEFSMEDLSTNYSEEISLTIHDLGVPLDEFLEGELESWSVGARVVAWPGRDEVAGRWEFSGGREADQLPTLTFRPDVPLERGWYALQVNFDLLAVRRGVYLSGPEFDESGRGAHSFHEGLTTSRFHTGSFPLVRVIGGTNPPEDGRDGGGTITLGFTEPVMSTVEFRPDALMQVTVGGRPVECRLDVTADVVRPGEMLTGWRWNCDAPRERGALQVIVTPPAWRGSSGENIHYCGTNGGTTWDADDVLVATNCDAGAFTTIAREAP